MIPNVHDTDAAAELDELCRQLTQTIKLLRAFAEADRTVDIGPLQGGIGLLCAKAMDLPPLDGRKIRPALIRLQLDLDGFGIAMQAAHSFHLRQKADPWSRPPQIYS